MRTPRGYASIIVTILVLATSAYFGTIGQKSVFTPETSRSQLKEPTGPTTPPTEQSNTVQVVVPATIPTEPNQEPQEIDTSVLPQRKGAGGEYIVKRVIDGDTIELEDGRKIRLIGVDTPETVDPRKEVQCFGPEAKEFTSNLLTGQWVRLETDVSTTDKYGRTLAYLWRDQVMVNDLLIKEGFARLLTIPPDVKYVEQFKQSQESARVQQKGLWGECTDE
ncbi:thermonuclease family protein [Candidatus Uhrbacteria bacterium]|nr:thermonuclease family protein [Candidatus Uhrbacteria bacterium]